MTLRCFGVGQQPTAVTAFALVVLRCFGVGQQGIGWAIWWMNVVLFILFSCLLLGRILFYSSTLRQLLKTPSQSLFLGAIPMSFNTISNGVLLFWAPRYL